MNNLNSLNMLNSLGGISAKKSYNVFKGKILVFGDLHLSCTYEGTHKNYLMECYENMDNILKKVTSSKEKVSAVFFLGDIIGVSERNIRDRQFLLDVALFFTRLNGLVGGNVFTVKGNHDKGDFPDFDFLGGLGLIKNPEYVDYYGILESEYNSETTDGLEVRFHFVNYGDEERTLSFPEGSSCSNIVLGHADYVVDGVTDWYLHKGGVKVSRLTNFVGVDMIISGHIHNPSTSIINTNIGYHEISLFYTGSPSRTSERIDDCWYVEFMYDESTNETNFDTKLFGMRPASEVFYPKEEISVGVSEEELVDKEQTERLTTFIKEIMECKATSGDLESQIYSIPWVSDEAKDTACKYLRRATDNYNS